MSLHGYTRIVLSIVTLAAVTRPSTTQYLDLSGNSVAVLGPVSRVAVVAGGDAALPCDVRPTVRNDTMLLVVWYRDDNPVYSYDRRIQGPSAHWLDEDFVGRVQWMSSPSSVLRVRSVQPRDRAVYRCRVDFSLSPTKNFQIALDVVELPGKPVIFDEFGREVSGVAGPYKEGSGFKLICTVNGGVPSPRIQWLQGDTVLTSVAGGSVEEAAGSRSLELHIRNATRSHHFSVYTCTADNTNLAPPQRTTVRVDLYLRPTSVEILSRELPLTVGRMAELWCKSTGARPPANITWWLDGKRMESTTKHQELQDRNETESLVQWTPLKGHNGRTLVCKAEHAQFDKSTIEARLPLNVYYMPEATIRLGSKMNPNDIEEGDDVYFECEVDANPPAYKVLWEHNGILLQHNPAQGVILTANTNLALRNITRHQAGDYSCTASNVEGDGRSQPLHMQVVYKPLCRRKDMRVIGAALQEAASIECQVDAFPAPHAFDWTLNNSLGSIKVDPERFTIEAEEGRSVLSYTPVAEVDYGTLSCRASNLAGRQAAPCLYTLLPATHPDPPTNCTVYNLTDDALDLICLPGYEGGLQNVYIAEVWANEGLVVNASSGVAVWNLRRLGAKRLLRLVVYAANARGRSEHVTFTVRTAARLLPRTEAQEAWEMNWAVGGVAGAACTVALILCLAFLAMRLRNRYRARDYEVTMQPTKNHKASLQKGNSNSPDDCNPDLIPLSKDVTEAPPEPPQYSAVVPKAECKNSSSSHSVARTHSPTTPIPSYPPHFDSQNTRNCANGNKRGPREIVTTRTPLLAGQQESCV